jgi:hypothetical protein
MPRPLNWIRGEGTVKNQRWGLAGLGDLITDVSYQTDVTHSTIPMYDPSGGGMADYASWANPTGVTWPDWASPSTSYTPSGGSTLGSWLQNNILLVGAGLAAFLLLRKR